MRRAAVLAALCGVASARRCSGPGSRVECGRGGNGLQPDEPPSESQCVSRGCCFDREAQTCHMSWVGDSANVTTVHLIQSNHFDAGYTNHIVDVINQYFTEYFPRAVTLGAELRKDNGTARLRWMTQAYLVSLYVDCPGGLGLKCPSSADVSKFEAAVKAGDITWHAFPQNAEMMMMDEPLLRFGISMTHDLDDRMGVPRKRTVSLRDVPGFERSVIPVVKGAGVTMLSEGMNGRIYPVNVPPAFVWRDGGSLSINDTVSPKSSPYGPVKPPSGEDILAVWHPRGYGPLGDYVQVPGLSHVLAYDWRNDNQGPPTTKSEVEAAFAQVSQDFPGATVIASDLDAFAAELEKVRDSLPIITDEIGDSWIWGVGSDPVKTARLRAIGRQRAGCDGCSGDAAVYNMSRLLIKGSEHTWGISVSNFGVYQRTGWPNSEFHRHRSSEKSYVKKFEQEWKSQMKYAVDAPVSALTASTPSPAAASLSKAIRAEYDALTPRTPDAAGEGFTRAGTVDQVLHMLGGWCDFGINATTGAVTTLVDHVGSASWADEEHPVALQRYQTLTETDYAAWRKEYLIQDCPSEYGKPGQDSEKGWKSAHQLKAPVPTQLWYKNTSAAAEVLVLLSFPSDLNTLYGSAAAAWVRYTLRQATADRDRGIDISVTYLNKTTTRLGEAMFVTFNPPPSAVDNQSYWAMDKLGRWVSPLECADGSPKGLHGVTTGVKFARKSQSGADQHVFFSSADAAMVSWDTPTPFPTPIHKQPDLSYGASFLLWNNIWNTNYIFWWPYDTSDSKMTDDVVFRFGIHFL